MTIDTTTVIDFQQQLGQFLRKTRLSKNIGVEEIATLTGLAEKSVRNLESGKGSTTETLFKVLTALQAKKMLRAILPGKATDSPLEVPRKRATRNRLKPNMPASA